MYYIIYEGIVSSVYLQYEISCCKYYVKADRLSFPFVDFYVLALTPRIHGSEAALQFAGNVTLVFFCCLGDISVLFGRILNALPYCK